MKYLSSVTSERERKKKSVRGYLCACVFLANTMDDQMKETAEMTIHRKRFDRQYGV
jgi:hypothetical protein